MTLRGSELTAARPLLRLFPAGAHAGRTIATLQRAFDEPTLAAELEASPEAVLALVRFLDAAFDEPGDPGTLPVLLIRLIVRHLVQADPPLRPDQLTLDLGAA